MVKFDLDWTEIDLLMLTERLKSMAERSEERSLFKEQICVVVDRR